MVTKLFQDQASSGRLTPLDGGFVVGLGGGMATRGGVAMSGAEEGRKGRRGEAPLENFMLRFIFFTAADKAGEGERRKESEGGEGLQKPL